MNRSNDLFPSNQSNTPARWRRRLEKERSYLGEFEHLTLLEWRDLLKKRKVTSSNHDTVLSLDWPHYCAHATVACGGPEGWCYTFQGRQATALHNRHAAMVDVLAKTHPALFAERVLAEVEKAVTDGEIPYKNIRFSGSGEMTEKHVDALGSVVASGVHAWGFTRNIAVAKKIRSIGAFVLLSCDATSPEGFAAEAIEAGFLLAYSSSGIEDLAPKGTLVTFPVHKVGRVKEVANVESLCPKVVSEFLHDDRPPSVCQQLCNRCHSLPEAR